MLQEYYKYITNITFMLQLCYRIKYNITNITTILQLCYIYITNTLKLDENTVTITLKLLQTYYIYYNNVTEVLQ